MNVLPASNGATHVANVFSDGNQGFDGVDVLIVYKKKGGVWVLHSPTSTEAASISDALSQLPKNTWHWLAS